MVSPKGSSSQSEVEQGSNDESDYTHRLLMAICHEVGNHLMAIRLWTDLAAQDAQLETAVAQNAVLCDAAGRLMSQVRFLLSRPRAAESIPVAAIMGRVRLLLLDVLEGPCTISFEVTPEIQTVHFDAEALIATLGWLMLETLEVLKNEGAITLKVSQSNGSTHFAVHSNAAPLDPEILDAKKPGRGRVLSLQVSNHVIKSRGGGIHLRSGEQEQHSTCIVRVPSRLRHAVADVAKT